MPVYFLCGGLGSGKSLMAVSRMAEKLQAGRPVATNINLDLSKLCDPSWPAPLVYRLPDFPTGEDLHGLGEVPQGGNEEHNGLVVLDEAGLYLNARDWNDKGRRGALEWFLHSRKLGWDVIFLTQSFGMVDKQIRESLLEYVATMRRLDRIMVPMFGKLIRAASFGLVSGKMPRVHTATITYGIGPGALPADSWHLRGVSLFGSYQTKQKFGPKHHEHGLCCMLPGASFVQVTPPAAELPRAPKVAGEVSPSGHALRPKLAHVQRVQQLPPDQRIPALRALGLAS